MDVPYAPLVRHGLAPPIPRTYDIVLLISLLLPCGKSVIRQPENFKPIAKAPGGM